MSRYLTPSKLCLVALIQTYCEGKIPSKATLHVLSFITSHLISGSPRTRRSTDNEGAETRDLTLNDFRSLLEGYNVASNDDKSENTSQQSTWPVFFDVLQRIDSIDALFDFFRGAKGLVKSEKDERQDIVHLSKASVFGSFVRRMCLEFERLQFHDAMKLWRHFQQYRKMAERDQNSTNNGETGTSKVFEGRSRSAKSGSDTMVAEESILDIINLRVDSANEMLVNSSVDETETLLEFQIDQMQKYGARLPNDMRSHFERVLQSCPESPNLSHYARFLEAWYAGDYPSSFESLHRYYDYAMHNKDRSHYQYALLNMAILQADFGSIAEAINAMNETISTARENKDMGCLNFSLNWIYFFRSFHGFQEHDLPQQPKLGSRFESLAFLKEKARESKMWSIVSSTLLSEAKLHFSLGDMPHIALDRVHESSLLNVHYNLTSMVGAQLMAQSSAFIRIGVSHLATLYTRLLIDSYGDAAPLDEVLRARCRIAHTLVNESEYKAAEKQLELIDPRVHRNLKQSQFLTVFTMALEFTKLLRFNDLARCEERVDALRTAQQTDYDMRFLLSMLEIDYLVKREHYSGAFAKIHELAMLCESNDLDVYYRIRLLCSKALLFVKVGRPQKGFTLALKATVAANRLKLLPVLWESVSALGAVLVGLSEFQASVDLINGIIYQVEEFQDLALTATLQASLADAYMGVAGQKQVHTPKSKTELKLSYQWLQKAHDSFHRLGDVSNRSECVAKLSLLCQLLDDENGTAQWEAELKNLLDGKSLSR